MTRSVRFSVMLIVAIFAASPVIGCCAMSHADMTQAVSSVAEPAPCHGDQQADSQHSQSDQAHTDECPGCANCDPAQIQEELANAFVSSSVVAAPLYAVVLHSVLVRQPVLFRFRPPGDSPPTSATPFSLKQRLLI